MFDYIKSLFGRDPDKPFSTASWSMDGESLIDANYGPTVSTFRQACLENPYMARYLRTIVDEEIGTGIEPIFAHDNPRIADQVQALWRQWEDQCDADGRTDFHGLVRMVAREERQSEAFTRLRFRDAKDASDLGLVVPLQLQVIPAQQVPLINETRTGVTVRAGVATNNIGQRLYYTVAKKRNGISLWGGDSTVNVPASQMLHIFEATTPGMPRGLPQGVAAVPILNRLRDFQEAALKRNQTAARISAILRRPTPIEAGIHPITGKPIVLTEEAYEAAGGSNYATYIKHGKEDLPHDVLITLMPGEDLAFPSLPSMGTDYEAFMLRNLLESASALNVPYFVLSSDTKNMTDRGARIELNAWRRALEAHTYTVYVHQFCIPVFKAFLSQAILANKLPAEAIETTATWQAQTHKYIHPVQDIQAKKLEQEIGLASVPEQARAQGKNYKDILEQQHEFAKKRAQNQAEIEKILRSGNSTEVPPDENSGESTP